MQKRIVVLTGAGISAESGLATFRGAEGLWENHRIEDVASPEGFARNPALVQRFYNERRAACAAAQPNAGHLALKALESGYEVQIITQNVDDLHERAGSSNVLHLHGELLWGCSTRNRAVRVHLGGQPIAYGDLAPDGGLLRPDIVWFGEDVPQMPHAYALAARADVMLVVGTSLNVYPAAYLVEEIGSRVPLYVIDPAPISIRRPANSTTHLREPATVALPRLVAELLASGTPADTSH